MRTSLAAAVAAIAVLGVGLTGCSSDAKAQAEGTDEVTLSVAAFEGGGTELACIPEINAEFEKKYPNITLDYKYVAQGQFDQYNNPRFAAGNAADVLMTNPTRVQQS